MEKSIEEKLDKIISLLNDQSISTKEVLNLIEASKYLDISHSTLYKLTSSGELTSYKPGGKKLYFRKEDLDIYLMKNKQLDDFDIEQEASNYLLNHERNPLL